MWPQGHAVCLHISSCLASKFSNGRQWHIAGVEGVDYVCIHVCCNAIVVAPEMYLALPPCVLNPYACYLGMALHTHLANVTRYVCYTIVYMQVGGH